MTRKKLQIFPLLCTLERFRKSYQMSGSKNVIAALKYNEKNGSNSTQTVCKELKCVCTFIFMCRYLSTFMILQMSTAEPKHISDVMVSHFSTNPTSNHLSVASRPLSDHACRTRHKIPRAPSPSNHVGRIHISHIACKSLGQNGPDVAQVVARGGGRLAPSLTLTVPRIQTSALPRL